MKIMCRIVSRYDVLYNHCIVHCNVSQKSTSSILGLHAIAITNLVKVCLEDRSKHISRKESQSQIPGISQQLKIELEAHRELVGADVADVASNV